MFEDGLLHLNATLAARVLSGPWAGWTLMNKTETAFPGLAKYFGSPPALFITWPAFQPFDMPFPFGFDVEPP